MEELSPLLSSLQKRRRNPIATYRLQLHKDFNFKQAEAVLPYLVQLGITDCYSSPLLMAAPGSQHGYDICDHNRLNPELGSDHDYAGFVNELEKQNMGHVLDFVPNHMGVYPDTNPWWHDVLENGPVSPYARFFDIDWDPIKPELKNKVLLPILGDQYGLVLERGELQLSFENGALVLNYFDHKIPVNPRQTPKVLKVGLEALQAEMKDDPALREFLSILTELEHLPSVQGATTERIEERQREKEVARERLAKLFQSSPRIRQHVTDGMKVFNGHPGHSQSFNPLHELLEAQFYRLSDWKTASHEINYRRFFDINELAGVRMEAPEVFRATHSLILRLLGENKILGLRLDHPDGLYDPASYFAELQNAFLESWAEHHKLPLEKGEVEGRKPLFVVGEKILSSGEDLPVSWSLDGTSGYDFLNDVNRLFVNPAHASRLRDIYIRFTGKTFPLEAVVYISKRLIMMTTMSSELNVLAHAINRISEQNRRSRDFTLDSLRDALREVVACFPVYRTYITEKECTPADRQTLERAIGRARRRNPAMEPSIFNFVREVLIPHGVAGLDPLEFKRRLEFSMKFQQYTGPVQAKGVEDTAFYRYIPLLSLNEVGGDPQKFGGTVKEFHEANARRARRWPHSMLATATHDTKRGEDARARINVLSEIPDLWQQKVEEWSRLNQGARTSFEGESLPDTNDEYLYYQALLGAWPAQSRDESREDLTKRMKAYMSKAIKEAKLKSSWIAPDVDYEKAMEQFVQKTLLGESSTAFLASFEPLARKIAAAGMINSLAQVVLKLTSPGVPDFYQGTELWDLSLVDPDNRRPVDYAHRQKLLSSLDTGVESADLLNSWEDGRIKMAVTAAGLRLRRSLPDLFLEGDYQPVTIEGDQADHVVAYARRFQESSVLVVIPRLLGSVMIHQEHAPIGVSWRLTRLVLPPELAGRSFRNIFTQKVVQPQLNGGDAGLSLVEVLEEWPVAILVDTPNEIRAAAPRRKPLEADRTYGERVTLTFLRPPSLQDRAAGVLLHPTSLFNVYPIGDLGPAAYAFADFLSASGQRWWQMLPLGPTGPGHSPYQAFSVFAGNPLLISPDFLVRDGLLSRSDVKGNSRSRGPVDYEAAQATKEHWLRKAFDVFSKSAKPSQREKFEHFCRQKKTWLNDYALFSAFRKAYDNEWTPVAARVARPPSSGAGSCGARSIQGGTLS